MDNSQAVAFEHEGGGSAQGGLRFLSVGGNPPKGMPQQRLSLGFLLLSRKTLCIASQDR